MSWKASNYRERDWSALRQPKDSWKKQKKTDEGDHIRAWDGRKIRLQDGDQPMPPSRSTLSTSGAGSSQEDTALRDMVKSLVDSRAIMDPDLSKQAAELIQEIPKEQIRREQKELNQRRKELTRREKIEEQLDNTQNGFKEGKSKVTHTVRVRRDQVYRRLSTIEGEAQQHRQGGERWHGLRRRRGKRAFWHEESASATRSCQPWVDGSEQTDHAAAGDAYIPGLCSRSPFSCLRCHQRCMLVLLSAVL